MLKKTWSKDKTTLYMLYRVVDESIFVKIVGASISIGHFGKKSSRVVTELNKCIFKP